MEDVKLHPSWQNLLITDPRDRRSYGKTIRSKQHRDVGLEQERIDRHDKEHIAALESRCVCHL